MTNFSFFEKSIRQSFTPFGHKLTPTVSEESILVSVIFSEHSSANKFENDTNVNLMF